MTAHLDPDALAALHYGEAADPAAETHLAACAECRAAREALRRVLDAVGAGEVPERDEDYGRRVWARLRPRLALGPRRVRRAAILRRLVPAGALAASLLAAFWLGRASREPELLGTEPIPEGARQRILRAAVDEHFERSQLVLVELENAPRDATVDVSAERRRAEELVPANRLYRQAALVAGERGVASVLDELERILLELARGPDELSARDLEGLRTRIEEQGLLFKLRVIGARVREPEPPVLPAPGTSS